jgi:hypothetical protein
MMNEQYSNTSPIAWLNSSPDGWCWRMCQASFPLDLDEEADWTLLQRLPDWIMWDGQALFEQATPLRLIAVRDGSASPNLPTPRAQMLVIKPWIRPLDQPQNLENALARLLPTPRAQNGEPRNMKPWVRPLDEPQNLENALARLPGVATRLPSNDGNESSDDQHPTLPTTEDCDPSSSSG